MLTADELRQGSPPRARGRLTIETVNLRRLGLTPACAGTSTRYRLQLNDRWAHPRVRGDVCLLTRAGPLLAGSPPRARGRRAVTGAAQVIRGLTPACAGTSSWKR